VPELWTRNGTPFWYLAAVRAARACRTVSMAMDLQILNQIGFSER
jgi:hypothetical protein